MGMPLNTSVVEREMSRKTGELYGATWNAHDAFKRAVLAYRDKPTQRNVRGIRDALSALHRVAARCERAGRKLADKGDQEGIVLLMMSGCADAFLDRWVDIFERAEAGEEFLIQPADLEMPNRP
jgi:hypothetical protein